MKLIRAEGSNPNVTEPDMLAKLGPLSLPKIPAGANAKSATPVKGANAFKTPLGANAGDAAPDRAPRAPNAPDGAKAGLVAPTNAPRAERTAEVVNVTVVLADIAPGGGGT